MAMTVAVLLLIMVSYAQVNTQELLKQYDLSNTVIKPYNGIISYDMVDYLSSESDEILYSVELRPEPLGFRGADFQRFYIHFDTVYKISPMVYQVEACSRCKDEIYQVAGRIVIDSVKIRKPEGEGAWLGCERGSIYAHYEMDASRGSKSVARLFGHSNYEYKRCYDNIRYDAHTPDGYMNNQYTGKWVWLATGDTLTCNWGDFRIPESGKLDIGSESFFPEEQYDDFGWKSYREASWYGGYMYSDYQHFLESIDENWWKYYEAKPGDTAPTLPGHYMYAHAFSYDLQGNHFDVHETGTMDFYADGSALDSARQVYIVTLKEGAKVRFEFNYISPSRWHLDGDDFYFSGIKEDFRMEVIRFSSDRDDEDFYTDWPPCDRARAAELVKEIVETVGSSIDYEYKFHLDTLTAHKLQWSFLYRDGHTDTWEFYR